MCEGRCRSHAEHTAVCCAAQNGVAKAHWAKYVPEDFLQSKFNETPTNVPKDSTPFKSVKRNQSAVHSTQQQVCCVRGLLCAESLQRTSTNFNTYLPSQSRPRNDGN